MAAPNLNAFLAALLRQVQKAEDALKAVIQERFLGFASGDNLDAIGRLVGEPRLGRLDDNVYRKAIRLRIYVNGSSGRPEDLMEVCRRWTGILAPEYEDVPQENGAGGNCRLILPGWDGADAAALLVFLQSIAPAGVRVISVTTGAGYDAFRMGDRMGTRLVHEI